MSHGWTVVLNGTTIAGSDAVPSGVPEVLGWMNAPPEGLGIPAIRAEDQTYPQRDGVTHYLDWYEPRTVTLDSVSITQDACAGLSAREKASALLQAWSRYCDDTELVLWPEVDDTVGPVEIVGPFGLRGKPRVAELTWNGQGSKSAQSVFRFDATDHRLYLLDADGTPGSGSECFDLDVQSPADPSSKYRRPDLRYALAEAAGSTSAYAAAPPSFVVHDVAESVDWFGNDSVLSGMGALAPNLGTSTFFNVVIGGVIDNAFPFFSTFDWADYNTFTFWWQAKEGGSTVGIMALDGSGVGGDDLFETDGLYINGVFHAFSGGTQAILEDGAAHYLAFVTSGANTLFYIDGVLAETISGIYITRSGVAAWPLMGYYSEMLLFSAALSAVEVAGQYSLSGYVSSETVTVSGTVCVPVIATFVGPLTFPEVRLDNGSFVGINMVIPSGGTVTVNTETGSGELYFGVLGPTSRVNDVDAFITGDPFLTLNSGDNEVTALNDKSSDTGTISLCWRPAVVSA